MRVPKRSSLTGTASSGGNLVSVRTIPVSSILRALALGAGAILSAGGLAWDRIKGILAQGWLTHQGIIEFGSVEGRNIHYLHYYVARLDYSYSVNGNYFSGFKEKVYLRKKSAERLLAMMKGNLVFVRSHPAKPQISALLKQDQPGWPS